eukprot:2544745-Pyramimonas_sp.AAC.1
MSAQTWSQVRQERRPCTCGVNDAIPCMNCTSWRVLANMSEAAPGLLAKPWLPSLAYSVLAHQSRNSCSSFVRE